MASKKQNQVQKFVSAVAEGDDDKARAVAAGDKASDIAAESAIPQKHRTLSAAIEQPQWKGVCCEIEGVTSLIQNAFPQKAMEQMLRKHMGLPVTREKKKPREILEAATIRNASGDVCIPPQAIKAAMITASSTIKGLKARQLMMGIFVVGQSIPITYERMVPRMDMCRVGTFPKQPDVRFRPMFEGWRASVMFRFADQIDIKTVLDLLNRAGFVGVGEWRPERRGVFGTFRVVRTLAPKDAEATRAACEPPIKGWTIPEWALDADIDMESLQKIVGSQSDDEVVTGEEVTGEEPPEES